MKQILLQARIFIWTIIVLCPSIAFAQDHEHEGEHEYEEEHQDMVTIDSSTAARMGVATDVASSSQISRTLLVYGKTVPDPQLVSHVTARYPGLIRRIAPRLGDTVNAGDVIAVIEANNSLQEYQIRAPLSGTVIDKHANPGELVTDQPLLTIANYDSLWVDLTLFPGDFQHIAIDMPVTITTDFLEAESSISYLNPSKGNSPTVVARVPLPNPDRHWIPGLLVEARILIERDTVAVAVKNSALQEFENAPVVFVQEGDTYSARPVTIGRADETWTEIQSGLNVGERYVVENSYLIKADLQKEGTEHSH